MFDLGIFRLASLLIECLCIAPPLHALIVMRGLVFKPLICMVLISGSYLVCLCVRAWSGNLLWQYVNSMSWTVSVGEGDIGVCVWFGAPIMHKMYGLNLACQWQASCEHVHLRSHSGIVYSSGLLLRLHALVSVKNPVFLLACSVWVMRCTALLCHASMRPFALGETLELLFFFLSLCACFFWWLLCKGT